MKHVIFEETPDKCTSNPNKVNPGDILEIIKKDGTVNQYIVHSVGYTIGRCRQCDLYKEYDKAIPVCLFNRGFKCVGATICKSVASVMEDL